MNKYVTKLHIATQLCSVALRTSLVTASAAAQTADSGFIRAFIKQANDCRGGLARESHQIGQLLPNDYYLTIKEGEYRTNA